MNKLNLKWYGIKKINLKDLTFRPIRNAKGFRLSNPSVLTVIALRGSLDVFDQTSMEELHAKSRELTGYLEYLVDNMLPKGSVRIITPRDPNQRGCQLSLLFPSNGMKIFDFISNRGVICDGNPVSFFIFSRTEARCDSNCTCSTLQYF